MPGDCSSRSRYRDQHRKLSTFVPGTSYIPPHEYVPGKPGKPYWHIFSASQRHMWCGYKLSTYGDLKAALSGCLSTQVGYKTWDPTTEVVQLTLEIDAAVFDIL